MHQFRLWIDRLTHLFLRVLCLLGTVPALSGPARAFDILSYHYDNLRTGWNDHETALNVASVTSNFGWLYSTPLDDQVDAQPLLVTNQTIKGKIKHQVLYVATESDTIYAIDATNGAVLLKRSLGAPVPMAMLPGGCNNNGPNVGVNSTPVIDLKARTMYVVAFTSDGGALSYHVHALNLGNLSDRATPVLVAASHTLGNGQQFKFNAGNQRQRPGLVIANKHVYAAFGSFCDYNANLSRGWVLGWDLGSLKPLASNQLNDRVASSPSNFFLSSVWMSGYGVAADPAGYLMFATGNSDAPTNTTPADTYGVPQNIQESFVKLSGNLTSIADYFTPGAPPYDYHQRDINDEDLGAGGVMLLPDQPGSTPHLVAAAGKHGPTYLLDRDHLGGFVRGGPDSVVATADSGVCWCGPSYFKGADGVGRLVTSGDQQVIVWKVETAPSVSLTKETHSATLPGGFHDPGFFTTVSSDGIAVGTAVIWAVSRPDSGNPNIIALFAIDPRNGATLFTSLAGTWFDVNGNPNIVPVVANGRVFVASGSELAAFGLHGRVFKPTPFHPRVTRPPVGDPDEIFGVVVKIDSSEITLKTRAGAEVRVDTTAAQKAGLVGGMAVGRAVKADGVTDPAGVLHANSVLRVKDFQGSWDRDR